MSPHTATLLSGLLASVPAPTTDGSPAGSDASGALAPWALLLMLLIVVGVVSVMGLLILWRLRVAGGSGPATKPDRGSSTPPVDPWFEAGQRAQPDPSHPDDQRDDAPGDGPTRSS